MRAALDETVNDAFSPDANTNTGADSAYVQISSSQIFVAVINVASKQHHNLRSKLKGN